MRRALRRAIGEGADPLGEAFAHLRSAESRRTLGATYTPAPIVTSMIEWASSQTLPHRIVDPGSGSARFAVAAGRRFPRALLLAIELDPVAALLGRAHLAAAGLAARSRVLVEDYRSVRCGRTDGPTLFIGNPPYVRHHLIEPRWKAWLSASAADRGLVASQLAGLHVHFFLATAAKGRPGDLGAFITSAEWLDVNYGRLVRELLLDGLGGSAIHVLDPTVRPFEDAATTGAITCFQIGTRPARVRLRRVGAIEDLGDLSGGRPVRRERLAEARRWTPLTRPARTMPEGHVELGEICRVHRGAVTGSNSVFVVDPERVRLPESVLFPSITRARELFAAGNILGRVDHLRAVIDIPADLDLFERAERTLIERFLRAARRAGAHAGYVARNRRAWWSVGLRAPAPILATYMARRPPAFVINRVAARHINVAHGLYPRQPMPGRAIGRLAAALRATVTTDSGRTYAGGLTKFEPREMERLPVPAPEVLLR